MLKAPEFIEKKFIRKNKVETRTYQINMADQLKSHNCLIILPTGLGKTTVALHVISSYLENTDGSVLFLAPTRVLVNQHVDFLKKNMTIRNITVITGEEAMEKRKQSWSDRIICATPEIVKNDLERGFVDPTNFSLLIFDEAHRTIGDYAYTSIAQHVLGKRDIRVLAMTATLPSEQQKINEIITKLKITKIEQRNEESPDVKPYIQDTKTDWHQVELTPDMKAIQTLIKLSLDKRYDKLAKGGLNVTSTKSLSTLLRIRPIVVTRKRYCSKPLFTAIRITYALNMYEAHGVTTFLKFCERAAKKNGAGVKELFEEDPEFSRAIHLAKVLQKNNIEHPKIDKLKEILKDNPGKAIVFSSFRDSVEVIKNELIAAGIKTDILIGKAGKDGLKQKKQIQALQRFRDGLYDVLVATRVGEEGLDISEVNLVVFYDNVPSSIRHVQRKGRTGRRNSGNVAILMAKDTIDEAYYWIGKKKIAAAKRISEKINKKIKPEKQGLDLFV